ncbi:MAG: ZIP family metal transporter [Candidatus Heimdallarchaeum endolithica]|uniref:ZIP family metal transporter n=1 Tax=Candidatus Heimdallarchaeum endolithica TaxID=2876572 RepID=A0A9Y1BQ57_9ARCH|nr:MAG: ZIP family metal transporter [Candidatus Heimdallarchaeum endolithica]
MNWYIVLIGTLASFVAGISTAIGALPVFFKKDISDKTLDILLGFASGVMLAASAFSLLVPALNLSIEEGGGFYIGSVPIKSIWLVSIGVITGALFIDLIDKWAPHEHFVAGPEGKISKRLAATWLFIIAVTIHNFPEGLAVGVSFGTEQISSGIIVAMAIGLQNIPEGTAVAMPLLREGYKQRKAFLIALFTGLVEPVGAFIGVVAVSVAKFFLGFGMAFAAGAMIFVVTDEIIPEMHGKKYARQVTFGIIFGFVLMMFLDNFIEPFLETIMR